MNNIIKKLLGLFKLGQTTSTEGVILHGLEETSPLVKKLVAVFEVIAEHPPTTPIAVISDAGVIIAILDPKEVSRIETVLDGIVDTLGTKFKSTAEEIADVKKEINSAIEKEFNVPTSEVV